jgi:hypothetical protein
VARYVVPRVPLASTSADARSSVSRSYGLSGALPRNTSFLPSLIIAGAIGGACDCFTASLSVLATVTVMGVVPPCTFAAAPAALPAGAARRRRRQATSPMMSRRMSAAPTMMPTIAQRDSFLFFSPADGVGGGAGGVELVHAASGASQSPVPRNALAGILASDAGTGPVTCALNDTLNRERFGR